MTQRVSWQLTYQDQNLPWRGTIKEEITELSISQNVDDPKGDTIGAAFTDGVSWETDPDGSFDETHVSNFPDPLPNANKYHSVGNHQKFKNMEDGGNGFGATFETYHWVDDAGAGGADHKKKE